MSRIGKQPIELPQGVKAELAGQLIKIQGPKGSLERKVRPEVKVHLEDTTLTIERQDDSQESRAFHGMERALLNNMVIGVSAGFMKELEVIGVGYRAQVKGKVLNLGLGFSHDIDFPIPEGVKIEVKNEGRQIFIVIQGTDKQSVGQVAAEIRSYRPPEPYKGKGVRYRNEQVRRKAGKAGK